MALTRITSGVISANAVSAEKLANGSLTSRVLANTSIELKHLASSANFTGSVNTVQANLTANNIQFTANLNTTSTNVAAVTSNVNIVSGNVGGVAANTIQNKANVDTALDNVIQIVANVDVVQDNVAAIIDGTTAFTGEVTMNDDLIVSGNLVINGTTTTANSVDLIVEDRIMFLANSLSGTPSQDTGLLLNRGSDGNVFIGHDVGDDRVVFAYTQSPQTNTTIALQKGIDVLANAFLANSAMNFSRPHFAHRDDPDTGIIFDSGNTHIKFIVAGAEQANLTSGGNLHLATGSIHSGNLNGGNQIDLDDDVFADRQNSIVVRSLQSIGFFLDWNDSETGNFLGVYDAEDDPNNVTKDDALFSVRDTGDVFVDQSINIGTTANVNGVDLLANDFATFTRLNANINVVNQNVDSGVGQVKKVNVITTSGSNVFYVNTPSATQIPTDIEKVNVYVDGVYQHPDDPGTSNNDFVYDSSDASVTITDPSLPNGLTVIIDALCPRP
jgi:hypothetical protein